MKKKTGLIILLSSICIMMLLVFLQNTGKKLSDCVVTESEAESIVAGRVMDNAMTPELYFGHERLIADLSAGEYYYSLISKSVETYDPYVRAGIGSRRINVAVIGRGNNQEKVITDRSIKEADETELLFYDEKNYVIRKLTCTTLPIMNISCGKDIDLDPSVATMELFDNREDADKRFFTSEAEVMLRGGTTKVYPKRAYKLSLTAESLGNHKRGNDVSLLGMRKDDDWVLYAAYNDQEKVRNVFSHNLWAYSCGEDNSVGVNSSPEYRYLELFIDGEYQGLYALGYTPDEKSLGLNSSALEGFFKKRTALNLETYVIKNKGSEEEGTGDNAELNRLIYDYYFDLQDNWDDPMYLKNGIDMDNALDYYLFICLIQGRDNLHKNYYTVMKQTDTGYKAVYIPWDMDMSWGNTWIATARDNSTAMYRDLPDENYLFTDGYLYWLLFDGDTETYDKLIDKYESLRRSAWSDESITALLDKYERDIFFSGAYIRDKKRWPEGNYIDGDYSLKTFKAFVLQRLSKMDAYIERLGKERDEDPFVNQTLIFDDLTGSDIVIRFDSRQALLDEAYQKFFEKCNIDTDDVVSDAGFILYRGSDSSQQEVSWDSDFEVGVDTILGKLWKGRSKEDNYDSDDDYSLFVGDINCMKVVAGARPLGITVIPKSGHAMEINTDKSYRANFNYDMITDKELCLESLPYTSGKAIIILENATDKELAFLDKFDLDIGGYISLSEAIENERRLVILLNCDQRKAIVINDAFVSGTVCETEIGTYAYFENDGNFGMYMDGDEMLTGSVDVNAGELPMVMLFNDDWTELISQKKFDNAE